MNGHGSMDPRLLQGLYFGPSQGLDKLTVVYELIGRIRILCARVIEGLPGDKDTRTEFFNGRWRDHANCLIGNLVRQPVRLVHKRIRWKRTKLSQIHSSVLSSVFNEWDNSGGDVRISL
jgi:hypothetical protein